VSPTGGAHIANDILEGINSLVQAAKAKARGYRTSRNLKPMIYLHPAAWPDLFHITRPVPHQLPSGSLETSMDGQALIRTAHRPNQVRSAKRLLNGHRARPDRRNRGNIAADEHVRSGRALVSCYCLDGGDAAANAQLHIDDHELRSPSRGGGNRTGLGALDQTDVAHAREHFGEESADHDIVFHHEDAERSHRLAHRLHMLLCRDAIP
jgi:hypothetical protein